MEIKHSLFQRKDNKRWVLSVSVDGAKKWTQITAPREVRSKADAATWVAIRLDEVRASGGRVKTEPKKEGMTVGEMVEAVLKYRESLSKEVPPRIRRSTFLNDQTNSKKLVAKWGPLPAVRVDVAEARAFLRDLRKNAGSATTRSVLSCARTTWGVAKAEKWITCDNPWRDPMVVAEMPEQRVKTGKPVVLSVASAVALGDCLRIPAVRRVRYVVAYLLGVDDGELAGIRWKNVYLDAPIPFVRIEAAVHIRGQKGFATEGELKTSNRLREIPLHPAAYEALRWWRYHGWPMHTGYHARDTDLVFCKRNGGAWRPKSAPLLRKDLAAAGVSPKDDRGFDLTFKSIRRGFSTTLRGVGVDSETRGSLMGHSGRSVTEEHYTLDELRPLYDAVRKMAFTWSPPAVRCPVRTGESSAQLPSSGSEEEFVIARQSEPHQDAPGEKANYLAGKHTRCKTPVPGDLRSRDVKTRRRKGDSPENGDDQTQTSLGFSRTTSERQRGLAHTLRQAVAGAIVGDEEGVQRLLRTAARQLGRGTGS